MTFDIRTIFIAFHVIVWINFSVMILAWYHAKSIRNVVGYWSLGQALYGLGTLLLIFRNIIPDFLSIVIANVFLVGAQCAIQEGLSRYMGRSGYLRLSSLTVAAFDIIFILYFTYFFPSVTFRIVTYGLAVTLVCAMNIRTVWTKSAPLDAPRIFLVLVLGFGIAILNLRSIFAIYDGIYADLMYSGLIQAVGVIGMLLAYASFSIALFWLVVHKIGLEIQFQAMTDSLTNAGNRRALDDLMDRQLPARDYKSVGVMMIDIDRFKEINDKFGHQAGDYYLVEFVRMIKQEEVLLFRYAGDEFVVIVYDADEAALQKRAGRLREIVELINIPWPDQRYINTTVSIGVTFDDAYARDWDELVKRADAALYQAKHEGGNKVMAYR